MPEVTKVSSMVTLGDGILIIKSHDRLNKWLYEETWYIKNIKSDS